jgi:hypothetical protein
MEMLIILHRLGSCIGGRDMQDLPCERERESLPVVLPSNNYELDRRMATNVLNITDMSDRGWVVLLGDFSDERVDLAAIARDFGWSGVQTSDPFELRELSRSRTIVAVLVHAGALGAHWRQALRTIRTAAPRARIIMCHKADQARNRTEMVDAGAFGVLLSPLAHSEVRQSLGFVWASKVRTAKPLSSVVAQCASAA